MVLLVLDKNFDIIGPIPLYTSLIWTRRTKSLGSFELYVTKEYFDRLNRGRYLYRNDAEELGVISEVYYEQNIQGTRTVYAKGYFAECLLRDRVISATETLKGNLEEVMRELVDEHCINTESDRVIEHLRLGDLKGLDATIDSQVTGVNLSDELYDIGSVERYNHRIRYDYQTNDLIFEIWTGKDRRDSQTENSWAIFSNSFYNIKDATYTWDETDYCNYAYVAGEEQEDGSRVIVEVDGRSDPTDERKELYVDARDLQSEEAGGESRTEAEYKELLEARGRTKLTNYAKTEYVESMIDSNANLVYKKDFDLGDLVDYVNTEIGVATEQEITEIQETFEKSSETITVTLGNDGLTSIQQLIKREA